MGDSINIEALPFAEALTTYQQAYENFLALLADYPTDLQTKSGVTGRWSPHEVVMHLCGWLIEAQRRFKRFPATGNVIYNVDVFNDVSVWDRENHTWEHSRQELEREYKKLLDLAQNVKEHHLERDNRYAEWLTSLAQEAQNHGAELQAFASSTAS